MIFLYVRIETIYKQKSKIREERRFLFSFLIFYFFVSITGFF
ncbi:hypothetical protein D920_01311 [Enterococcus faecalis 13-SD-W-01]|nr:hypothetical protein D920_01311 [Enterococcus faecalis 13-SD-W-01]